MKFVRIFIILLLYAFTLQSEELSYNVDIDIIKPWGFNLNGNKIVVLDEENNVNIYEFK